MSSNNNRSVSLSSSARKDLKFKDQTIRSTSIKTEDQQFLNSSADSTTNNQEEDDVGEPVKDIDIVGAISTLKLDEDDDDNKEKQDVDSNTTNGFPIYGSLHPEPFIPNKTWNIPVDEDENKKQSKNKSGLNNLLDDILDPLSGNEPKNKINSIPFVPYNENNNTGSDVSGSTNANGGPLPLPHHMPPPHIPMGVPPPPPPPHPFSPFPPHPSFYQGYVPNPGEFQNFENMPPPMHPHQLPQLQGGPQPPPPNMWNHLNSPRLPYQPIPQQQQQQQTQPQSQQQQQPVTPQQHQQHLPHQFPPQQQFGQFANFPQNQPGGAGRPYFRNNNNNNNNGNNMMNIHRKNLRRKEDLNKYANAKVQDFTGQILSLCKDQHGCRFLQRELYNDVNASLIFNEIYFKVVDLMIDPFGNYLVQKLIETVNVDQRLILIKNASLDLFRISLDPHGTRALQKLIDVVETDEEIDLIIQNIRPHIVTLSRDLNGNHVVQKILTKFNNPAQNQFIFDIVNDNLLHIACHRHGCCVLQRCLDYGSQEQRTNLSLLISQYTFKLSLDPFGNYVVQYVLSRCDDLEKIIDLILSQIKLNLLDLSLHKFGSNVIEKCLRIPEMNQKLIDWLITDHEASFNQLVNDPYGNYVLQTMLDVANLDQFEKLKVILMPLLPNIKNTPHGRRILHKFQ
ncbi:PUF4 Pumilioy domain family member 4 [Candida maltosa Xu316]